MKILNISLEKKLFEKNSKSRQRVEEYARLFDRFDLIVLSKRGHEAIDFGNMAIEPTDSFGKLFYLIDAYFLGKKLINKYRHDFVSSQDPFELGLVAWRLARKYKLKLQIQLHGDYFDSPYWRRESFFNFFRYCLGKFLVKRADTLRVVSERIKKSVIKLGVEAEKITVVPIYTPIYTPVLANADAGKFIFLTAGRLVGVKNIDLQIKAMREILETQPETELWIAGDGPEKNKLQVLSKKLKVEGKIKFIGWQENLEGYYNKAGAFILTSNYEGWGMVVVEAAGFGLPIIMTDVGCAGELIKNGESGIVVKVGDLGSLVQAMKKILEDRNFAEKIGANARIAALSLPDKNQNLDLYKKSFNV